MNRQAWMGMLLLGACVLLLAADPSWAAESAEGGGAGETAKNIFGGILDIVGGILGAIGEMLVKIGEVFTGAVD